MPKYYCSDCQRELVKRKQVSGRIYLEPCALCLKRANSRSETKHTTESHSPDMVTAFIMDEDGY